MNKEDKCGLCGCKRKHHEEGRGICFNCNEFHSLETGCMSFDEDYNEERIRQYKETVEHFKKNLKL